MASLDEKWKAVDNFKSVVVDRERDVVRVTKELYDLHSNREQLRVVTSSNNYRLTIPFAPHMFGSGKTTFYVTYLELKIRSILNIPSDQYLLIAFDEVGVLDESLDEFHFKRTHGGRVRPYNDFFGIISQLCKEPDLFFIVVGKSEGLNIYNYVASVSRVQLVFIPLSPLEKHSIVEHLEKSSSFLFPGSPKVSEILCHEDFSTSELAGIVVELTGGVPGLLVRAISYLLLYKSSNNNFLLSKETFLIIMNSFLVTNYCVATFLPRLISLSEQRKRLLRMLWLLSLYRIRFDFDETVQISSNSDVFCLI
ncbi:hypothetical protein Gasu2_48430 [Galdieria sulphuraria]|nr:hypothetical protein Gasu2_48430 [Galdieria sulphuraria]